MLSLGALRRSVSESISSVCQNSVRNSLDQAARSTRSNRIDSRRPNCSALPRMMRSRGSLLVSMLPGGREGCCCRRGAGRGGAAAGGGGGGGGSEGGGGGAGLGGFSQGENTCSAARKEFCRARFSRNELGRKGRSMTAFAGYELSADRSRGAL